MKKVYFACAFVLALSSCSSTITRTVKTMDIYGPGVLFKPVIADLEVKNEKVTGTAEGRGKVVSVEMLQQRALQEAVKKSDCNVIVEPVYETEYKGKKIIVTAIGYPAYYKNFRQIEDADIKLLEVGIAQKANVEKPIAPPKKKNRVGAWIAAGISTVVTIGLLIALLSQ